MGNKENGYSKKDFEEFLIKKILGKKPSKYSFDYIWGMYIAPISTILLGIYVYMVFLKMPTLFGFTSYKSDDQSIRILTQITAHVSIFASLIYGLFAFMRISVYKKTIIYFQFKDKIIGEKEKFKTILKSDMEETGVNLDLVGNIKENISYILQGYRIISKSYLYIQTHLRYFGKIPQEGQDIIKTELQWIINYSQEFALLVQSWISHHATELAELEKQIASQELSTENIGGKVALGISRISLQEHLKELEKVRV